MADINSDDLVKALNAATMAFDTHTRAMDIASRAQSAATTAVDAYADANTKAAAEADAASAKTKAALGNLSSAVGKSALDFSKALVTGGEGTTKYAGSVTGAADALGGFISGMGPLGMVVGGLVKVFGALVGASLKQNDQLMKSYRELAEVGSVSGSLEQLQLELGKVGLTTEDAAKFGSMLKKVAPDLAGFGGSVSAGKDKLLGIVQGLIGPNNQIEIAMGRIGYGAEEMRDATSDYVAKQTRMGLAQGKTTEQLRNESVKYMVSLRELGELTGMSRDEAQRLMDEQQADARWAMTLRKIEVEEGHEAAERARSGMALYSAEFGKQSASDLMEQIANKGAIVGEASARAEQSSNGEAYANFRKVINGSSDGVRMIIDTSNAMDRNLKVLDGSLMVAGKGLDSLTGGYQQMGGVFKNAGRTYEEVDARLKADMAKSGGLLNANLTTEQKNRALRIAADQSLMNVTGVSVSVFQKLNEVVFSLGKSLAKFIDGLTGTGMFGMKATNWSETFRDLGDNAADMKTATKEKASLVSEIAATKKEIAAAEAAGVNSTVNAAALQDQMRAKEKQIFDMQKEISQIKDITLKKEAAAALAKEKLALRELNQQAMDSSKDGKLDSSAITEAKKKLLQEKQSKLIAEDEKIQKLEKEKLTLDHAAGTSASATATSAAVAANGQPAPPKAAGGVRGGQGGATAAQMGSAAAVLKFTGNSGSEESYSQLDPELQKRLLAAGEAYAAATGGNKLQINSANRSLEDQTRLYKETTDAGRDGFGPTGMPVAKPGTSRHESGRAVDIQNYTDPAAIKAMNDQGLFQNVKGDEVHFELPKARTGGMFAGPTSGYPVELHGKNESVWPEDKLKAVLAEVQKTSIEDYKKEILADMGLNKSPTGTTPSAPSNNDGMAQMMEIMTAKFDDMIAHLDTSNSTLHNLLTYARA